MHIKAHTTRKNTKNLSIVQNNLPRPPDQLIRKTSLFGRPVYWESAEKKDIIIQGGNRDRAEGFSRRQQHPHPQRQREHRSAHFPDVPHAL